MRDLLLIVNLNDAASTAVARSLRAEHICCHIVPRDITPEEVSARQPLGLILAGDVSGNVPAPIQGEILNGEWPVLALGDAAAMLCSQLGGEALETVLCGTIGTVTFSPCALTEGMEDCERVLHNARRLRLPDSFSPFALCQDEIVGFLSESLPFYGLQFGLELNDTDGIQLLMNFALSVCHCTRWWDYEAFTKDAVARIREAVGDGRAVCAMTGGLNSGISALLAHRALGERLQCIFIDTGLLRENEARDFLAFYRSQAGLNIMHVSAQERFVEALSGIVDPALKKRVIGETLQSILDETLAGMGKFTAVVRSVICSDVLRGVDYRNRPGIHADLPVIEPLRELFKDEVRLAGDYLGMPTEVLLRQTFPGSGLALRILGEVTPARLQTLRAADLIFTTEAKNAGQNRRLRQHFAILSALSGDDTHVMVILRAITTGEAARLPHELLEEITTRILRERPEVARVVYDLSPVSAATGAEWQ